MIEYPPILVLLIPPFAIYRVYGIAYNVFSDQIYSRGNGIQRKCGVASTRTMLICLASVEQSLSDLLYLISQT